MDLMGHFYHIFHNFRRRSNRVRSHKTGSCGNSAERSRFIPKQVQLVFLLGNSQFPQLHSLHGSDSRVITFLENFFILINHRLPFFRKTFRNKAVERRFRKSEQSCAHTESGNVFHLHGSVLLCHFRNGERQENTSRMRLPFRFKSIVGNNNTAFTNFLPVKIDRFLVKSHKTIHMLPDRRNFLGRDTQGNRRMSAFNPGCKQALAEKRISLLRQNTPQNFSAGFNALSLLSSHFPDKIFLFHSIFLLVDVQ